MHRLTCQKCEDETTIADSKPAGRNTRKFVERRISKGNKTLKAFMRKRKKNPFQTNATDEEIMGTLEEVKGVGTENLPQVSNVVVTGKRVFMRVDLDVPHSKKDPTKIKSTKKIEHSVLIIEDVLEKGAKSVVLASHFGRPKGRVVKNYCLKPVAQILSG